MPGANKESAAGGAAADVDLSTLQNQRIGLILSENTLNSIKWKKDEIDRINRNFTGVTWSSSSDLSSILPVDHSGLAVSVERMLRERFKNTTLVPDLHAAINEGIDTAIVIDIHASAERTCPSSVSDCYLDTRSEHSLFFVDTKTRTPILTLRGDASINYCDLPKADLDFAYDKCIQDSRIRSLEVLRQKLAARFPNATEKQSAAAHDSVSATTPLHGYEENKNTIETGAPAEMYSLGLRMEQSGNVALAEVVYQAIVRRFPDSPFAAKALERQEAMVAR